MKLYRINSTLWLIAIPKFGHVSSYNAALCSIGSPPTKNFRLSHCFGPAYLLDLLHNPKWTGSSLSLNSPIYWSGKGVLIIAFPLEQLTRITSSQWCIIIKQVLVYGHPKTLLPLPSVRICPHLTKSPLWGRPLSGWLLTLEWAPFDAALVPQGPLRLISCSPKLLFSYYTGAVVSNSLWRALSI